MGCCRDGRMIWYFWERTEKDEEEQMNKTARRSQRPNQNVLDNGGAEPQDSGQEREEFEALAKDSQEEFEASTEDSQEEFEALAKDSQEEFEASTEDSQEEFEALAEDS
ncbi:parathymosin-like [Penaeus vannamei]|uniref:parathymosin-like n=1 Tax=Penaeus vannamei TaxID=6689 RepID=UPI00387F64C9